MEVLVNILRSAAVDLGQHILDDGFDTKHAHASDVRTLVRNLFHREIFILFWHDLRDKSLYTVQVDL